MRKTSHHPRLIHKEEKEEENNSDDQQFPVHEQCLSDRDDLILPCLSESPRGKHLNNISAFVTITALSINVYIP